MWNDVKISAVISAYNEENTVAAVVETALKSNIIDEVILINDGSTDNTIQILYNVLNVCRYYYY